MKNNKQCNIYISCPVSEPFNKIIAIESKFKDYAEINYWDRVNKYDNNFIKNCDIFILVLPFNCFKHHIDDLPIGCKKELTEAKERNKKICISYINSFKEPNLYNINMYDGIIEGVIGSAHTIYSTIKLFKDIQTTVAEPNLTISPGVMKQTNNDYYSNSLINQMNHGNISYKSLKDLTDYLSTTVDYYHDVKLVNELHNYKFEHNNILHRRLLLKLK